MEITGEEVESYEFRFFQPGCYSFCFLVRGSQLERSMTADILSSGGSPVGFVPSHLIAQYIKK
jgi:hypothetical protein